MSDITFIGPEFSESISHIGLYSDNTPYVKTEKFEEIVEKARTLLLRPTSISSLFTGLAMAASVHAQGGHLKNLVIPYLPGARQDRINPTGDVLCTSRMVAEMINLLGFDVVHVADPHSWVSTDAINNCFIYPYIDIYSRLYKGYDAVIAPDKGGRERAGIAARVLDIPLVEASKVRDVTNGRLSGFDVTVEAGKHYIVVDDICDGGGTFVGLGEKIAEQGAFADLFVTHGIFSKGTNELKKFYRNIYTTNTRDIHERNDVYVFDIVKGMIDYV